MLRASCEPALTTDAYYVPALGLFIRIYLDQGQSIKADNYLAELGQLATNAVQARLPAARYALGQSPSLRDAGLSSNLGVALPEGFRLHGRARRLAVVMTKPAWPFVMPIPGEIVRLCSMRPGPWNVELS